MSRLLPVVFAAAMAVVLISEAAAQNDRSTAMPSGRGERNIAASATVEAIDLNTRTLVLRRKDGTTAAVHVDEQVKNLPQVRVGDQVQVNYREAIAFEVRPAGELAPSTSMKEALATAKPGERPSALGTQVATVVATIDAIKPETPSVLLRTADGKVTEVRVRDPNNLKRVKIGDHVQVTYSQALAVSVFDTSASSGSSAPASRSGTRVTTNELNRQELDRIQGAH